MDRYRQPPKDIISYSADLSKRVAKLERVPRAIATAIDTGGLTVNNGAGITIKDDGFLQILKANGQQVVFIGRLKGTFTGTDAANYIQFFRTNGNVILQIFDDDQVVQGTSVEIHDNTAQRIFSDNMFAGGLRDPFLSVGWRDASTASISTSSTTFQLVANTYFYLYHYATFPEVAYTCPVGTTGELRLRMDYQGVNTSSLYRVAFDGSGSTPSPVSLVGLTQNAANNGFATGFPSFATYDGPIVPTLGPGTDTGGPVRLAVEVRRTGGTVANVSAVVNSWYNGGS